MSQLIPDNNVLLQFVPNVLKSVQGETLLFDKITPHLEVAEAWLTTTFLSEEILTELPTVSENANNKLLHYARMAVVAEAMLHAVPQLDLVLTSNGFGVVSNTNIACCPRKPPCRSLWHGYPVLQSPQHRSPRSHPLLLAGRQYAGLHR